MAEFARTNAGMIDNQYVLLDVGIVLAEAKSRYVTIATELKLDHIDGKELEDMATYLADREIFVKYCKFADPHLLLTFADVDIVDESDWHFTKPVEPTKKTIEFQIF
jgi:hypothetical protein